MNEIVSFQLNEVGASILLDLFPLFLCPVYLKSNFLGIEVEPAIVVVIHFIGMTTFRHQLIVRDCASTEGLSYQSVIPVVWKCSTDLTWCMSQPMISAGQEIKHPAGDACPGPQLDSTAPSSTEQKITLFNSMSCLIWLTVPWQFNMNLHVRSL